ncbi:hypothetical protein HMPREF1544_10049 [Mucor circinelloides 1006PhL]|uniref:Uncharacterized protein n=1 Tax=Mucor circinelloides f. circinelloides (strain 1006PhL) TaxID=1220926 RepID=S2IZK5_MUCC1|nr:hypothetical protein HMPREF1544_10049 [Mucor circinelloides 1006PhL]
MTAQEINESLCPSKTKMLLEVINGPWSNAYLHFATAESASVFFHQHKNEQLILNDAVFSVQEAKYRNGEKVKYAFKQINFTGSSAAAPAPAAAHSIEWVASTKRALISIDNEIRELKRRRKYLKKALRN